MNYAATFRNVLWAITLASEVLLLVWMFLRKNHRIFPFFYLYILVAVLQTGVLAWSYRTWGDGSLTAWRIAWLTQIAVVISRGLAILEICRRYLSRFPGVWALAWRLLLACGALVLAVALLLSRYQWNLAVLNADRGVELAAAAIVVVLLVFGRHYHVEAEPVVHSLAIGFLFFSCFWVVNVSVLERLLDRYTAQWNILSMFAFLASLLVWMSALRHPLVAVAPEENLLPEGLYQSLSPEINSRLRELNARLDHIFHRQERL